MKLAKFRAAVRPMALSVPHWLTITLVTLATAFGGAVQQYLQAVPFAQWITGLSNPTSLEPIARGAILAGFAALFAQGLLLFKQWAATVEVLPTAPPSVPPPATPPVQA